MNEQKRMETFYDKYKVEYLVPFREFMRWDKDKDGEYEAPLAQLLWAGWQAAQFGQKSFDFGEPEKTGFIGDR